MVCRASTGRAQVHAVKLVVGCCRCAALFIEEQSHLVLARYDDKGVNILPYLPRGKGGIEVVDLIVVRQLKFYLCANIETRCEPSYGLIVETEDRRAGRDDVQTARFFARVLNREGQHEQQSRADVFEYDLFRYA